MQTARGHTLGPRHEKDLAPPSPQAPSIIHHETLTSPRPRLALQPLKDNVYARAWVWGAGGTGLMASCEVGASRTPSETAFIP